MNLTPESATKLFLFNIVHHMMRHVINMIDVGRNLIYLSLVLDQDLKPNMFTNMGLDLKLSKCLIGIANDFITRYEYLINLYGIEKSLIIASINSMDGKGGCLLELLQLESNDIKMMTNRQLLEHCLDLYNKERIKIIIPYMKTNIKDIIDLKEKQHPQFNFDLN